MKVGYIFSLILAFTFVSKNHAQQTVKPNILFIAIDDLKPTIGAYNDSFAVTPVLDKFSENAAVFLNNHCQQAVCGPSRASLMTGKRPDYTRVRDLKTRMRDINPDILALPQYFKENGYFTLGTGKIYDPRCVDKDIDKPSWSIPFYKEKNLKYPKEYGAPVFGYYQNKDIKKRIAELEKEAEAKGIKNPGKYVRKRYKPPFEMSDAPDEAYMDGAIARKGIELIDRVSKDPSKPFFLAIGFKRPHLPFVAPKKYWDKFDENKVPYAVFQRKARNGPSIAYHNSGELRSYKDPEIEYVISKENLLKLDKETQKKLIHGYYAATNFVDTQVGKILDKLKKTGLDKNTIIIIWGDHGWHLGDHSLWNKHTAFEQATRSPMMIYVPGIEKGIRITSPTEFVDIFPTLCELSGLEVPEILDGNSLAPLVKGTSKSVKKYAVSQQPRGKDKTGYSFRTDRYRYTVWLGNNKKSDDRFDKKNIIAQELYDYQSDPLETVNHFGEPAYKKAQEELIRYSLEFFSKEYSKKKNNKTSVIPDRSIKQILKENYDTESVYVGATLNYKQLETDVKDLFLKDFTYSTPENCAKQTRVHPKPEEWNWDRIDSFVKFAKDHGITVRLHGPVSPQASRWAKSDSRTASELEKNMTEFMKAQCKRFNNNKAVKWMDVVNETVARNGDWFKDKSGTDKWENPWVKIGYDKNGVPKYITKAFRIANKYATGISLVYNQHGGMEPAMWEKVKKTILYLKSQGLRVNGVGWQAHLKSTEDLMLEQKSLDYLGELIDWAHANDLDFHVTEIDYKIMDGNKTPEALDKQAEAYANVLKVLLTKRNSGVVTYNTWGIVDDEGPNTDKYMYIYNEDRTPKPAYFAIKKALIESK